MKKSVLAITMLWAFLMSSAWGQLTFTANTQLAWVTAARSDSAFVSYLLQEDAELPSFTYDGILFDRIPNFDLYSLGVGKIEGLGTFYLDVSYFGKDSQAPNTFGASIDESGFGTGGQVLFSNYGDTINTTYRITAPELSTVNFWHYSDAVPYNWTKFHNDDNVATYQGVDLENGLIHTFFRWEDQGRDGHFDRNDLIIHVVGNIEPINADPDPAPVPEPSAYGIAACLVLIGLVCIRRGRSNASPFVQQTS